MRSVPAADTRWRIAEVFLFPTCTYQCAYCLFAENGTVLDASQLRPYRDPEGWVEPIGFDALRSEITHAGLRFSTATPGIGQTTTSAELSLAPEAVRTTYRAHQSYLTNDYADEFVSRQKKHDRAADRGECCRAG